MIVDNAISFSNVAELSDLLGRRHDLHELLWSPRFFVEIFLLMRGGERLQAGLVIGHNQRLPRVLAGRQEEYLREGGQLVALTPLGSPMKRI